MAYLLGTCSASYHGPNVCGASQYMLLLSVISNLVEKYYIPQTCEQYPKRKNYDFIIVGGGTAGSAIAARLSEIRGWKVLLIEAGPEEPLGALVPGMVANYLGSELDWQYSTVNEKNACLSTNGSCSWPRGKNLGGTSVHHGMMYMRGNPKDYDNWNLPGWYWKDVLPYFKRSENNLDIEDEFHSRGGPLSVSRFPWQPPITEDILKAAEEAGYGRSDDLNGRNITGFTVAQTTNYKGVRISGASAFLRYANKGRANLDIVLDAHVTRILFDNSDPPRATGVEYLKNNQRSRVYTNREVILSAGAVGSPHLLLLSGVGPEHDLESMNIKVVKDLPGVGENLQNHVSYTLRFTVNDNSSVSFADAAKQYNNSQTGPLSSTGLSQLTGIVDSENGDPENPDIQFYFRGYSPSCSTNSSGSQQTIGIVPAYLHPQSRGTLKLASRDPRKYPVITQNYLQKKADLNGVIDGIRIALSLVKSPALKTYNFTLVSDPIDACKNHSFPSKNYWGCAIKYNTDPENHQGGSCKMGLSWDSMAVVDPELRVYGVQGLRVVDASILPKLTSGNIAAPVYMIAEKAADFIKRDCSNPRYCHGKPKHFPIKFAEKVLRQPSRYPYPPYLYYDEDQHHHRRCF